MTAYVALVPGCDEKEAEPTFIGPFDSRAAAHAWLDVDKSAGWPGNRPEVDRWFFASAEVYGGYPFVYVVSEELAVEPDAWLAEVAEVEAEETD